MKDRRDFCSLAIAFYPILSIYSTGIPGISIGELALLFLSFFYLIKRKKRIQFKFKGFAIYTICISLLMCGLHAEYTFSTFAFHAVSTLLIIYLISVACSIGNLDEVVKQLKNLCLYSIIFFAAQYLLFVVSGTTISGIVSFLPLSNGENSAEFHELQMGRDRMSSLFEEPAHFSEFLCVPLCLYLFNSRDKKDFIFCILITVCIFLSTSALGAVSVVIIWGMRFLEFLRQGNHKWLSYFTIIVIVFALPTLTATEIVTATTSRIAEISGVGVENSVHGFSSYIRVLRGYIPFTEQNVFIQIVGNGVGSLESYIKTHHSQYLSLVDGLPDYINSIQYILLGSGVIGLFLFLKQIYVVFKSSTPSGRTLLLTMFAQMFASGIHSSPVFLIAFFIAAKQANK